MIKHEKMTQNETNGKPKIQSNNLFIVFVQLQSLILLTVVTRQNSTRSLSVGGRIGHPEKYHANQNNGDKQ